MSYIIVGRERALQNSYPNNYLNNYALFYE